MSSGALATEQTALGSCRVQANYLMGSRPASEVEQCCEQVQSNSRGESKVSSDSIKSESRQQ